VLLTFALVGALGPEAIATYCLPLTSKLIGGAAKPEMAANVEFERGFLYGPRDGFVILSALALIADAKAVSCRTAAIDVMHQRTRAVQQRTPIRSPRRRGTQRQHIVRDVADEIEAGAVRDVDQIDGRTKDGHSRRTKLF